MIVANSIYFFLVLSIFLKSDVWTQNFNFRNDLLLKLDVLTTAVTGGTTTIVEPLLRFPFVHSLVDPCGSLLDITNEGSVKYGTPIMAPLRDLSQDIPLDQQVLNFLSPLYQQLSRSTAVNDAKLNGELKLVVSQALQLIPFIYSPLDLSKCDGFEMQSLPPEFVASFTGDIQSKELYHSLVIITAHLHVMIYDRYDSSKFCASENFDQLQFLRQLSGKLETSMCLILQQSALIIEGSENNSNYLTARKVLQSYVQRYFACSAREIQRCLVLRNAHRILNLIQRHTNN